MATRTRQMHEFLTGYLGPSSGPPTFGVPSKPLNARLPLSPGDGIPEGHRPIPTSSESNKKTNAQIPYVRQVYSAREKTTAGVSVAPKEGDIVLVERTTMLRKEEQPGARLGHGTNSYAYTRTIESLNPELAKPRDEAYTYDSFPYRLDGVINNVDSEDPQREFRDYTIANVAVYGPCRLDHGEATRCDFKKTHPGSVLYVGLYRKLVDPNNLNGQVTHALVRFSSAQLSRGVHNLDDPEQELVCAWTLGMLMDSNQSKNMVTAFVNVSPVRTISADDAEGYQIYNDDEGNERRVYERGFNEQANIAYLSAADQLKAKWHVPTLLPRSMDPPPDHARPSASWY
jgi:hypothetical protein